MGRKNHWPVVLVALLVPLMLGQTGTSMFGCVGVPPGQEDSAGTAEDQADDSPEPGGENGTADAGDDPGADDPSDAGDDPSDDGSGPEVDADTQGGGMVGDTTCVPIDLVEPVTAIPCASGPCGSVRWQNDCDESLVLIVLDAAREKVLQIIGVTPSGVAIAIVDPEDWSGDMAYGIVTGTDAIECNSTASCSVSGLIERGLLDLDQLAVIDVD